MQHQKIRPQTSTPTARAAMPAQVHRTRISVACLVTPLCQPKRKLRSTSLAEQPVSSKASEPTSSPTQPPPPPAPCPSSTTHRTLPLGLVQQPSGAYWTADSARPRGGPTRGAAHP